MDLDQRLVDAAIDQMDRRWPATEQAVAAAVYLDNGQILTGVSLDNLNAAATLCAETGVLCQAYTLNRQITASVCVSRDAGSSDVNILAPCGICQERLALWAPLSSWLSQIPPMPLDGSRGHSLRSTLLLGSALRRRRHLALVGGPHLLTDF
jgi:cytidine deaminase